MKYPRHKLLCLIAALWVLIPVITSTATDTRRQWAEFTRDDGWFSVSYPGDWSIYTYDYLTALYLFNSETLQAQFAEEFYVEIQPGDSMLTISVYSLNFLRAALSMKIEPDVDTNSLITGIEEFYQNGGWNFRNYSLSEVWIEEISEDVTVGIVHYTADQADEGIVMAYEVDGVVFLAEGVTEYGELDEAMQRLWIEIFSTFQLNLTTREFLEILGEN